MKRRIKRITEKILNVFYPRHCPVCQEILKDQSRLICPECEQTLHPVDEPRCFLCGKPVGDGEEYCSDCRKHTRMFTQGRGIFFYDKKMKVSLMKYKYYGCREYGAFYARALCLYGEKELKRWKPDVIVPVPLYWKKRRIRGLTRRKIWQQAFQDTREFPCMQDLW